MFTKKNRAIVRIPSNAILNCDDRKKFSAIVALLVQVNKRINPTQELRRTGPDEYAAPARIRSKKKTKECTLENLYKEGSQNCGPLLFLIKRLVFYKSLFLT
jgi:hypothetical protein